jgi:hypothetical protein
MKQKMPVAIALILYVLASSGQTGNLPVKEWNAPGQTPFVLYISGCNLVSSD